MNNARVWAVAVLWAIWTSMAGAAPFDQQADNQREDLGYYYVITGGKFPNGQTVNGTKPSGGSMNFILDAPDWQGWGYNYTLDEWHKDGWFEETAGLALTMKNGETVVFDNFNNDTGDFYTCPPGQASADTPGLYRGYSMSNNYDWIYAGYFKLNEATTVDTIIGYFDPTSGFDPDSSQIAGYRMNIWYSQDVAHGDDTWKMPTLARFTGDVLSSDSTAGTFIWGDSGVDRVFGDDYGNAHDDIWYLQWNLSDPFVLAEGEYFFSHDAMVVPIPLPGAVLLGMLGLGAAGMKLRKYV